MKTKKITEIKNGYPKKIIVDNKQIVSYLAKWAIRQSPYCIPANLEKALLLSTAYLNLLNEERFYIISVKKLRKILDEMIQQIPEIRNWNNSKSGDKKYVFVSAFDVPNPDEDFIDLNALSMNIVIDCLNEHRRNLAYEK
jgi:hypothetical protein